MLFIFLCLAVWVCLKLGSENMGLVMLLQIGAKDFTMFYKTIGDETKIVSQFFNFPNSLLKGKHKW